MGRRSAIGLTLALALACSAEDGGVAGAGASGGSSGNGGGSGGSSGSWGNGGAGAQGGGGTSGSSGGSAGSGGSGVDPCEPIAGVSYGTLPTVGPVTDRPAPEHADLNIKLRGWSETGGTLGLVDIDGPTDLLAPRLNTFWPDDRVPVFLKNYRVNNWDWSQNKRSGPITESEVSLVGFQTTTGEVLEVPNSGYDIGQGNQVRVLFADNDSITLKYTGEDNVVYGYTLHVVGLCVEPSLKALYDAKDAAGRGELPALTANQPIGRARSGEVLVSIRDTGAFMDPRSKKDWW
jgi:hypothetical protein